MPESMIRYFGQPMKVNCDGNCRKAWGINTRPRVQLSDNEDDYAFKPDGDLADAPVDPGTYEGGHAEPMSAEEFPNKWCVRECERCNSSMPGKSGEPLSVKTFDELVYQNLWGLSGDFHRKCQSGSACNFCLILESLTFRPGSTSKHTDVKFLQHDEAAELRLALMDLEDAFRESM